MSNHTCHTCNKIIDDADKFCKHCGEDQMRKSDPSIQINHILAHFPWFLKNIQEDHRIDMIVAIIKEEGFNEVIQKLSQITVFLNSTSNQEYQLHAFHHPWTFINSMLGV